MDSETRATDVNYVRVAPYAITKCANHWHVVDGVSGEHIVTQPNELTREQALDEADRLNHEAGWPTQPAAAPHAAPREGEPDESEPEIDWLTERGEAARAALLGFIRNGGCSDCSALRFRIAELESALASQQAALDAAGEDTKRIDWLERERFRPAGYDIPAAASLRQAIDAARASHPEARDGTPMLDEYQATERLGLRSGAIRAVADEQEATMTALEDAAKRDWSPTDTGDEPC